MPAVSSAEHEAFKNRLVDEVLGKDADDRVPMEKVVMLIWAFRDDPTVVTFMARFVAKYAGSRHVFDGIEFYLPQLAHMIIHLEVEWDDAILERFALVIAQQSLHFALQLNWILQGALEDYQPELQGLGDDGIAGSPNPTYNANFYNRCLKLLKNVERCVVYGKPRSQELQRLYEQGQITKSEMIILEQADRRFNALQITETSQEEEDIRSSMHMRGMTLDGWVYVQMPHYKQTPSRGEMIHHSLHNSNSAHGGTSSKPAAEPVNGESANGGNNSSNSSNTPNPNNFVYRFCVLQRHVLNCYTQKGCCAGGSTENLALDRAMSLERSRIMDEPSNDSLGIRIETPFYEFTLRFSTPEEKKLWLRRLKEEAGDEVVPATAATAAAPAPQDGKDPIPHAQQQHVFGKTREEVLKRELTPAQLIRYDFFQNERQFIYHLTQVAEDLRELDRDTRKALAPQLMAQLPIPETVYLPLCNSSDIWRRVSAALPKETRVFNTKERCPVIMFFISKRGEIHRGKRIDPNLDVAEYVHTYFEVSDEKPIANIQEAELEDEDEEAKVEISGAFSNDPQPESPPATSKNGHKKPQSEQGQGKGGNTNPTSLEVTEDSAEIKIDSPGIEMVEKGGHDNDIETKAEETKGNRSPRRDASKKKFLGRQGKATKGKVEAGKHESSAPKPAAEQDRGASNVWLEDEEEANEREGMKRGNRKVQRLMRESVVTLPTMLAKRLTPAGRMDTRRRISVVDRQTKMQPAVPILEGSRSAQDDASVGEGTVVSVEKSSVLVKDTIVLGDLEEGDIDIDSINRAKKFVCGGESWAEKSARMLDAARKAADMDGENVQLEITSCMAKSNDDLRQEVFVMQMIHYFKSVFAKAKLPLWLKTYRILSTSSNTGLLEVLTDATSIDGLKKSEGFPGSLRKYFELAYGGPKSKAFKAAQRNFMQSLAAYAIVSYLLGLKDRHNGNIMIDTRGHLIFIDFGFALGMAPGHEFSMERAPFKLTKEYVDVMGGIYSRCYMEFERLFVAGFMEARQNSQIALGLVEIMMFQSNYPCFSGWRYGNGKALQLFEKRLMLRVPERAARQRAMELVRVSRRHGGTYLYDVFQKATNGYAI